MEVVWRGGIGGLEVCVWGRGVRVRSGKVCVCAGGGGGGEREGSGGRRLEVTSYFIAKAKGKS